MGEYVACKIDSPFPVSAAVEVPLDGSFGKSNSDSVLRSQMARRSCSPEASMVTWSVANRPHADRPIGLLTLGTVPFLCIANQTTLKSFGLAAKAMFGDLDALSEMTWSPRLVIGERGQNWKRRNCNGESKDKNVRARTVPVRCTGWSCTGWRRVLRRGLS
jgi:hypothetical protein